MLRTNPLIFIDNSSHTQDNPANFLRFSSNPFLACSHIGAIYLTHITWILNSSIMPYVSKHVYISVPQYICISLSQCPTLYLFISVSNCILVDVSSTGLVVCAVSLYLCVSMSPCVHVPYWSWSVFMCHCITVSHCSCVLYWSYCVVCVPVFMCLLVYISSAGPDVCLCVSMYLCLTHCLLVAMSLSGYVMLSLCLYVSVSCCLFFSVSYYVTLYLYYLCVLISFCDSVVYRSCCVSLCFLVSVSLLYVSVPGTSPPVTPRGSLSDEHCVNVCCTVAIPHVR